MPVRMTGMISGLDTESLIKGLVDAQKLKNKKTVDKSTLLTWKQDKWKELNAKLYKLYTDDLSKMRLQGNYKTKVVTSSNESFVTVTGDANAPIGSHTISNIEMASGQYVTSVEVNKVVNKTVNGSSKLVGDLGMSDETQIKVAINGETKMVIDIDANTTVSSFVQKLKDAGLNASFDESQQRFFISSKESGEKSKFTLTTFADSGITDKRAIDSAVGYSNLSSTNRAKVDSAYLVIKNADPTILEAARTSTEILDTDDDATKAVKNAVADLINLADTKFKNDALNVATTEARKELEAAIKNGTTYADVDYAGVYDALVNTAKSEIELQHPEETVDFSAEPYKTEFEKLVAKHLEARVNSDIGFDKVKEIITTKQNDIIANGKTIDNGDGTNTIIPTLNNVITTLKDNIVSYGSATTSPIAEGQLGRLGLAEIKDDGSGNIIVSDTNVALINAKDSKFTYNGAVLKGTSNVVTVNGLTFTLKGETTSSISLNVSNNTQETYDMVKKFIKSYNEILKEMNDLYYAETAKGYDPLSDDEKETMTDGQIEKWEKKIQDSILRRDSSLGSLLDAMKNAMMTRVQVDGKNYSLSSYGIQTSVDFTEKGLLHIHGNKEDGVYSAYEDKLMKALEQDPETVVEVLSKVSTKLYETMAEKMSAIPNVRSAFTFYNDKLMIKQQTEYKSQIAILEKKLVAMENKYYKQFAAMEKTLGKLQQQTNALTGMLGLGQ